MHDKIINLRPSLVGLSVWSCTVHLHGLQLSHQSWDRMACRMSRLLFDDVETSMQIKDNKDKIKLNNQLPYLVGNVVEVLEMQPEEDDEDDGANVDLDSQRRGKCVVLKTSTRQTIFLPVVGLVDADALKPADLVGVNKVRTALHLMLPCISRLTLQRSSCTSSWL